MAHFDLRVQSAMSEKQVTFYDHHCLNTYCLLRTNATLRNNGCVTLINKKVSAQTFLEVHYSKIDSLRPLIGEDLYWVGRNLFSGYFEF